MSVDNTIEQLLARAILDLELKMKHEIRQNSALHLARIEKHNQQLEKRLDIIEAKLEALINRDSQAHAPRNSMQHFSSGGRHSPHTSTTGRVSYYPRSPNLANGHPHHVGGARPTSKRLSTMGNPASTIGYGSGWGPNSVPSSAVRAVGGIQQQHKHAYERKQYQSKQPLGTGGNRASLGEKSANKTPWPNRGGNFTDDVTDASEDDNSSQTGSESPYSVAKPACKPEDDCINKDCEEEDDNDGNEEKFEKLSSKGEGVTDDDADDDNASAKMNGGSNDDFDEKENYNNEDNNIVETSVVVTSTIVTPGAMISPVSGGFGRSRRN